MGDSLSQRKKKEGKWLHLSLQSQAHHPLPTLESRAGLPLPQLPVSLPPDKGRNSVTASTVCLLQEKGQLCRVCAETPCLSSVLFISALTLL